MYIYMEIKILILQILKILKLIVVLIKVKSL